MSQSRSLGSIDRTNIVPRCRAPLFPPVVDNSIAVTSNVSSSFWRCRKLKRVLTKSFDKSRSFIRAETRRLSGSWVFGGLTRRSKNTATVTTQLPIPRGPEDDWPKQRLSAVPRMHARLSTRRKRRPPPPPIPRNLDDTNDDIASLGTLTVGDSSWHLETLFAIDETEPITSQLAKAVQICRQVPELEASPEMVEAERLLLYSNFKYNPNRTFPSKLPNLHGGSPNLLFYIDGIELKARPKFVNDPFFNYFYTITFECGGLVQSTKSVECLDGRVKFEDCGIEYPLYPSDINEANCHQPPFQIRCSVFMLRLRKVSALGQEPRRRLLSLVSHLMLFLSFLSRSNPQI